MGVRVVIGIPRERGDYLPFVLSLGRRGLWIGWFGDGRCNSEEGLAGDFGVVATDGEPTGLDGDPNGDFDSDEFGPLGSVFAEDKFDTSLVDLTALAFFFDPLGIGGERSVMASIATEEATG